MDISLEQAGASSHYSLVAREKAKAKTQPGPELAMV